MDKLRNLAFIERLKFPELFIGTNYRVVVIIKQEWHVVVLYRDLARAKSEALDNIYSLFKQNIKS